MDGLGWGASSSKDELACLARSFSFGASFMQIDLDLVFLVFFFGLYYGK